MMRVTSPLRFVLALAVALPACGSDTSSPPPPTGQTDFVSAPPAGGGTKTGVGEPPTAGPPSEGDSAGGNGGQQPARTVEETDIYRLDGNYLYYLNGYRGLMVFDLSDIDHPRLVGRSPIYGSPVEMVVRNGVATVVVADWYGAFEDGSPFYGSIVRGLDARDPAHIKLLGEARLGGWVRDTRVVGDVL